MVYEQQVYTATNALILTDNNSITADKAKQLKPINLEVVRG
jgi:hypothetical protein